MAAEDNGRVWGRRGTAGAVIAGRLTVEGMTYAAGGHSILNGVSLDLQPGSIACLLGPSGCGKTTLLRLIAGLEQPGSGRILLDGREIAGASAFLRPEERNIGLMFQDFALFPHLTVLKNVAFGLRDLPRDDAEKIALRALERVGLADRAGTYPMALSGGEQQRVALARAIVPRPQVILLDEPFSGLDQRLREQVRDETIALLRETRSTALLVTHDAGEAMEVADHILLMRHGRIVQAGPPQEVFARPADPQSTRFFSVVNELTGTVRNGMAETPIGSFASDLPGGSQALVMIRPQAIRLARRGEGVEGLVADARFLGETTRCAVLFNGIESPVTAVIGSGARPAKGETAFFRVDPEQVLVFAKPSH